MVKEVVVSRIYQDGPYKKEKVIQEIINLRKQIEDPQKNFKDIERDSFNYIKGESRWMK